MVGIVNAGDYGRSIQEAWARRQMIDIAEDLVNTAFGPGKKTTLEIVASTIGQLESTLVRHGDETDVKLADAVAKVIDAMQNAMAGEVPRIYSTGIPDLDGIIGGGLRPADLIVLGGRPGHGKSALATQISAAFCQRYSLPVYFFTMEMTSDQQAARILSQMSGISTDRIELGQISTNEAEKLVKAQRDLAELKVYFDDRPRLDVPQLRLAVRRFKRRYGKPGLIVVDHMHLMRVQQADMKLGLPFAIGQLANSLKEIAKEEDCPMVALAQLNRSKESSDDKVPTMADLKSSGDIEAAADVVLFTHRAELHMHKAKPTRKPGESDSEYQNREQQYQQALADVRGKVELVSAKVRKGATSAIEMRFDGPTTTFLTVS
jgi:replicative DNA helicase